MIIAQARRLAMFVGGLMWPCWGRSRRVTPPCGRHVQK